MNLLVLNQIIAFIAAFISLCAYRKSNPPYLKLLSVLLILIFITEFIGGAFAKRGMNNTFIYNIISIIIFTYFLYFFQATIQNRNRKRIFRYILFILPCICLTNILFIQGINTFHTYTYSFSCLIMVGLAITFFIDFFNRPSGNKGFFEPEFWISVAIIFYNIANVSIIGVVNIISKMPVKAIETIQILLLSISTCFYILLTISFLCQIYPMKSLSRR